jgi:hypothetical protein
MIEKQILQILSFAIAGRRAHDFGQCGNFSLGGSRC